MTESKNPRLNERAAVTEEHRKWAQQVWDEIADDDECCIGNPEGSEFIEENIIPKLAQLLADRDAAQAVMLEAISAPARQPVSAPAEKKEWVTAEDIRTVSSDVCEGFCGDAAKDLSEILTPRIEAHIAAAYRDASQHDYIWQTGNCRCGKKLNDYETDDITWDEHICSLTLADAAKAFELAEVRAALKESEWWCRNLHRQWDRDYSNVCRPSCMWCKRFSELKAREAELLARGGGK